MFYDKVPKDQFDNLAYRAELRKTAAYSDKTRRMLIRACREDVLFFFNAFCFLYEPRPKIVDGIRLPKVIPFITWPHQDEVITTIREHLGFEDIGCVSEGTLIVTSEGLVPIEQVTSCHMVYDGIGFVQSEGAVFRGVKDVIDAYGVDLTPDHQVLTIEGWKDASKGVDRREVRKPECNWLYRKTAHFPMRLRGRKNQRSRRRNEGGESRRKSKLLLGLPSSNQTDNNPRHGSLASVRRMGGNSTEMYESRVWGLGALRRSRNHHLRSMAGLFQFLGGHGANLSRRINNRASREQRRVLSRELHLGRSQDAGVQSTNKPLRRSERRDGACSGVSSQSWDQRIQYAGANCKRDGFNSVSSESKGLRHSARTYDHCRNGKACRHSSENNADENLQLQVAARALVGATQQARTYDILNCGPRKRFVAVGRDGRMVILHNCEKSRGEGMSWIAVLLALNDWIFQDEMKIGIVSRTEEAADDPEDSDSMFWKIDWEISKLPQWMVGVKGKDYKRIVDRHTLTNHRNKSIIKAGAATGDVFRGGRLTYAVMDEFAFFKKGDDAEALNSSHGATNSRLFISTVNGQHNEYFRIMHEPSSMIKVVVDWRQNISRNRGLYKMKDGSPVAIDPVKNPLPAHYNPPSKAVLDEFSSLRKKGFKLEKSVRSPWYDHECNRPGMTPQRVAQELDRDYSGSEFLVFGSEFMDKVNAAVCQPTHVGNFTVLEETGEGELKLDVQFQSIHDGAFRLWLPLDINGNPPAGRYVLGGDVCTGLGGDYTSNSTLVGLNADTGEQVLAFASNTVEPSDFADLSVGIAHWLHNAYLGWEHNGPGSAFTKRVIQLKYGNVYRRKSHSKKTKRRTKEIGWWTDDRTKPAMFADIVRTVRSSEIIIKDGLLRDEFKQYIYINGKIEHASSLMTDDDSSKGKAHGDRVIGLGVATECFSDRSFVNHVKTGPSKSVDQFTGKIPPDSMAARFREYEREDYRNSVRDGWYGSVLRRR